MATAAGGTNWPGASYDPEKPPYGQLTAIDLVQGLPLMGELIAFRLPS